MEIKNLTFNELIAAVVVILILVGIYNTIMTAIKNHREEKKIKNAPIDKINSRLDFHDKCLENDKLRLEALERTAAELRENNKDRDRGTNILMRCELAMLRHMQHGNNAEGMRESEKELTDYLTGKGQ